MIQSSNTRTTSSGEALSVQNDVEDNTFFVNEYNRLATKVCGQFPRVPAKLIVLSMACEHCFQKTPTRVWYVENAIISSMRANISGAGRFRKRIKQIGQLVLAQDPQENFVNSKRQVEERSAHQT
jgi:hypothetical protein